jgi:hypothetical protein
MLITYYRTIKIRETKKEYYYFISSYNIVVHTHLLNNIPIYNLIYINTCKIKIHKKI